MTVILGIKTDSQIILAGDKRLSDKEGQVLSDEGKKILPINKNLCIATAGNISIGQAILLAINKKNDVDNMHIEDILNIICELYSRLRGNELSMLQFHFIVAGSRQDGTPDMVAGQNKQGDIVAQSVPISLSAPMDCPAEKCNTIFMSNLRSHRPEFIEKTISEIADISNVVSPTGDKWIYDISLQEGTSSSF